MTAATNIEPLGNHAYLVRLRQGDDPVEIRLRATPDVVNLVAPGADDERVIRATVAYLLARQRADELPPQLDLDDIAATYGDYVESVRAATS